MLYELNFPTPKLAAIHGEVACKVESRVVIDHLLSGDVPDPMSRQRFLADWTGIGSILHFLVATFADQMPIAALVDGSVPWNHKAHWT